MSAPVNIFPFFRYESPLNHTALLNRATSNSYTNRADMATPLCGQVRTRSTRTGWLALSVLAAGPVGYTMRDIRYKWNAGLQSVGMSKEVELPQFRVLGHRQRQTVINLTTGKDPCGPIRRGWWGLRSKKEEILVYTTILISTSNHKLFFYI